MKKYSLKRNLVALTLASAFIFNLTGCTTSNHSNSNSDYENETVEEMEEEIVDEFNKEIEVPVETMIPEKRYDASELFVLDSQSSSVIDAVNLTSRFHFLVKTGEKNYVDEFSEDVYDVYIDIYNEGADVTIGENRWGLYIGPGKTSYELISYAVTDGVNPLSSFERFLAENGLETFISKDGTYSLEDVTNVKDAVKSNEKAKEYQYK